MSSDSRPTKSASSGLTGEPGPVGDVRLIDQWFPCPEVDSAVGAPAGSGRSEKALFTWFASRPIAQARAAVLCSLLPDSAQNREDIRLAISTGDGGAVDRLRQAVMNAFGGQRPVVLDMFSGRGIIPLEASRAGANALGTDLSPVATLAGRLLGDVALRNWSQEPALPFTARGALTPAGGDGNAASGTPALFDAREELNPRLVTDVEVLLNEVGRRVAASVREYYPIDLGDQRFNPWAFVWAVTIPCDGCSRRFPLLGSLVLRHPYARTGDLGQWLHLTTDDKSWVCNVRDGFPEASPTFAAVPGKRGKSARCPYEACGHVHTLDVVKAKGFADQYEDSLLVVAEIDSETGRKVFRPPTREEVRAVGLAEAASAAPIGRLSAIPDETIPEGNSNSIQASVFGYKTYGSLMNRRQALLFATTARIISEIHTEMQKSVSSEYATALVGFAAANLMRQMKYATRGAGLRAHGDSSGRRQNNCQADHVFSSQSVIKHQFDYIEVGPYGGPGSWLSVSKSLLQALRIVIAGSGRDVLPGRFSRASAVRLPFRDNSIDVMVTDPPYYDMITYADSSDLFHVWFKRALGAAIPDLFGGALDDIDGLQDKTDEIIVKSKGRRVEGEHRTQDFYEGMLAKSFAEAKRVLRPSGHLTVIFGHSDPDAWKRLLNALADAGFVVTSSWPSRTETAVTGVATISVTVSIGCRVAPTGRPTGIAAQVDAEVLADVKQRCRQWDTDGLALEDQMMASYGAALSVVGRYASVITPAGEAVPLEHYMSLARRAVREAVALRLDEQPLETFDPFTRLAVFWHELYGRSEVPKGEARFFAQSDELRIEDLRGPILEETRAGYRLRHDAPGAISPTSSMYEVVRAMAAAQSSGTEAVGTVIASAEMSPTDAHLWALVDWVGARLPQSDPVAVSLAAIKRNGAVIQSAAASATERIAPDRQLKLKDTP